MRTFYHLGNDAAHMSEPSPHALPDYDNVASTLKRCNLSQCPAELHGLALGLTLAVADGAKAIWQQELYADFDPADVLAAECRAQLDRLYAAVFAEEQSAQMALTLLLPEGIAVNTERLLAVRDWCQGFLFGFGLAGEGVAADLSAQSRELLGDFAEISRLETDDVENSEENRAALIEIEEYLREGVMLIREELAAARSRRSGAASE